MLKKDYEILSESFRVFYIDQWTTIEQQGMLDFVIEELAQKFGKRAKFNRRLFVQSCKGLNNNNEFPATAPNQPIPRRSNRNTNPVDPIVNSTDGDTQITQQQREYAIAYNEAPGQNPGIIRRDEAANWQWPGSLQAADQAMSLLQEEVQSDSQPLPRRPSRP